jgi:NAD(P)H-dependent flavin oxidoreductase YrpB (nitropropane dioxygenase family)
MRRNALCERLGIELPILSGGMTATGNASLCAAVSNAGGLGMLTCLHCRTPPALRDEIARTRQLTCAPSV